MSKLTISKKIKELPPEAKEQVRDFVDVLYQSYVKSEAPEKSNRKSVTESSFFGIWKDREDMQNSS